MSPNLIGEGISDNSVIDRCVHVSEESVFVSLTDRNVYMSDESFSLTGTCTSDESLMSHADACMGDVFVMMTGI